MNFLQKLINAVNVNFKLKLSQCHVKQGKVLQLFFSLFSLNHIQSAIIYNTYIVFLSILKIFPVLLRKKKKRIFKFRRKEMVKVALGVCFALKSWKEYLLLFTYLISLGKDVTLLLITKFKTNRPLSNLLVNRIPN